MTRLEKLAWESVDTPTKLRKRLMEARSVLAPHLRPLFQPCQFDKRSKSLVSNDGKLRLVWKLRKRPDQPESYVNQQTSVGSVTVETTVTPETIH